MAAGNQWKHLEFTLALSKRLLSLSKLENIRIGTSLNILVTHLAIRGIETCYPETIPMSRIVKELGHLQNSLTFFRSETLARFITR